MNKVEAKEKLSIKNETVCVRRTDLKDDNATIKEAIRPDVPPRNIPVKKPIPKPRKKGNEGINGREMNLQEAITNLEKPWIRVLREIFYTEVESIAQMLREEHVSINLKDNDEELVIRGTAKGIETSSELFSQFIISKTNYTEKDFKGCRAELILSGKGKRALMQIEQKTKVVIDIESKGEDAGAPLSDWKEVGVTFDERNFKTNEGITVSWKNGNVANEKVDILVNSAASNLNEPTACGQALNAVGGKVFVQACKPHTNLLVGNITYTTAGDLKCDYVIHAVCGNWNRNEEEHSKKTLRGLLQKILFQGEQLQAQSLAMPTLGMGKHRYPENIVRRIIEEEVTLFSKNNPSALLKNIRVIVFDPQPPTSQPLQEKTSSLFSSKVKEAVYNKVRVCLFKGNITQHPVDAILNVLPYDLQLSRGGEVSNNILKDGGKLVQEQVNSNQKAHSGSVIATSAGKMTATQLILHFLPKTENAQALEKSLEKCLEVAKSRSLNSLSISAIGTENMQICPERSAEIILTAVQNFSSSEYPLSLNVVIQDKSVFRAFERVFEKENSNHGKRQEKDDLNNNPKLTITFTPRSTQHLSKKVILHVYARWQNDIDKAFGKIEKFINHHLVKKEIESKNLSDVLFRHWSEVESMASRHNVTITCKSATMANIEGGHKGVLECNESLSRFLQTDHAGIYLPSHWDQQPPDKLVHLVPLSSGSLEYQQVSDHFMAENESNEIINIQRIQNQHLYNAYLIKKRRMNGEENEMQLFYGTKEENVTLINTNNFRRSYGGLSAVNIYGNGVYLTKDAVHSIPFCQPGKDDYCYMYLAKALVGNYIAGSKDTRTPRPRNKSENAGQLYDSAVNDIQNPNIFVLFSDDQYYPEYLITFKKSIKL